MCGRYSQRAELKELRLKFPFVGDEYFDAHGYRKRPEIFPGTDILAINNRYSAEDIWWTVGDRAWDGKLVNAINAKAETIRKVRMFKDAFAKDRVLLPATSLYEWQVQPDGSKVKYEISFDEPLFAFAGIARDCELKGETKRCGVIITTTPNEIFKEIHNTKQRQAVVIREEDYEKWLDPATKEDDLQELLRPLPEAETHFQVAG